jgi:hypothetical protein
MTADLYQRVIDALLDAGIDPDTVKVTVPDGADHKVAFVQAVTVGPLTWVIDYPRACELAGAFGNQRTTIPSGNGAGLVIAFAECGTLTITYGGAR